MYVYNRDDATRKDIENFDSEIQEKTNRNVARWQQLEFRYTHTHVHTLAHIHTNCYVNDYTKCKLDQTKNI